ncbi:thiol-activated cytolysin family protein [Enterococcus faecalis]|uniref:thiol-activated cytolysin family protein n=1 Tax=Enterococcus faecalis TaxID=1351 RepID=UPI0025B15F61|nr:thiol-activated cytolysin family protein [Enterococcus faecalis]MDN3109664.1 thiol-activated cytolysin family protein [Enterococcus faecalis]
MFVNRSDFSNFFSVKSIKAFGSNIENSAINDFIYSLSYDPLKILRFQGDSISNLPSTESDWRNGVFYVVEKKKKSINNGSSDISYLSAGEGNLYQGRPTAVSAEKKD